MTMEKLLAVMFLSRDVAHAMHWRTTGKGSYAQHSALGSFYSDIIENADSIAETYMGRHGVLGEIPSMSLTQKVTKENVDNILESHMEMIEEGRYEACESDDTPIQNLIDEAVGTYLSVLYKLRNLE